MDGTGPQLIATKSVSKAQVQITGKITAIDTVNTVKYRLHCMALLKIDSAVN